MVAVLLAVVCGAGSARAQTSGDAYIPTTQSYTTESFQGGQTLSFHLHATQDITFNSLGFIDANDNPAVDYHYFTAGDGIHDDYLVELLLTSTQQLLASATVTPSSPLGQYSSFRYAPIPATTIQAGQDFTVAVVLPSTLLDPWLMDVTNTNQYGLSGPVRHHGLPRPGSGQPGPAPAAPPARGSSPWRASWQAFEVKSWHLMEPRGGVRRFESERIGK
jgi:hypothetical protein